MPHPAHDFALSVHAYYAGELDAGRRAAERLLRLPMPPDKERIVRRNRTWYTQLLDELAETRFTRLDIEPARPGWSLFNPSIVAMDGGYLANVRSSNYQIVGGRYVIPPEDGETIKTENLLVRLGTDLRVLDIRQADAAYEKTAYPVDGLEDVRLNAVDGRVVASATVRNFRGLDGTCRIATADLLPNVAAFVDINCIHTPDGKHEKNWMPLVGRRQWLYSCHDDGHVATVRQDGEHWSITRHAPAPHVARGFRGGSQLVPVGNGRWLALVHEVAIEDDGRRIYEHRFVLFDEAAGWTLAALSPLFAFREQRAIEFAAGLAARGDVLVAAFGVRDAEAWLVELRLADVLGLMEAT
jgi:hypothetical protein